MTDLHPEDMVKAYHAERLIDIVEEIADNATANDPGRMMENGYMPNSADGLCACAEALHKIANSMPMIFEAISGVEKTNSQIAEHLQRLVNATR